jgi:hypothetical protein
MGRKFSLLVRVFITLAVVMSLGAIFAQPIIAQPPPLPHAFYGTLTIDGEPAPVGTTVEVRGEGVKTKIQGNPIITAKAGWYGSEDPLEAKLIVQGEIAEGTTLTFYVNGESTGKTVTWHTGEISRIDLTVTSSGQPAAVSEPPSAPVEVPVATMEEPAETVEGPLEAATPSEAESMTNWPVIGGIIAAVIVVGLLIFFFVIRKKKAAY